MDRLLLFAKGICMGLADVVPGVSGGTLALILGIYKEFIDALRSLSLSWLGPLWRWLSGGRRPEDWLAFRAEFDRMHLGFLIVLGLGIFTALGVGSVVIPSAMEAYPVAMRAFFVGLIVASVWVPFRMIEIGRETKIALVVLGAVLGGVFGWVATAPSKSFEMTRQWVEVEAAEGQTLKEIARSGPSAVTTEELFWAPQNEALREAVAADQSQIMAELQASHDAAMATSGTDKAAMKARAAPYNELVLAAGVPVEVPRPALWYVFVAGAVAICAMLLPGISGSYILLILGVYFFILNALKGFIKNAVSGALPVDQASFVVVFCIGAGIGLLSFARLLSWLLSRYPAYTLAVLVGLMVGCLRGIWPFRRLIDGVPHNVWPTAFNETVGLALATFVVGFAIVAFLTWVGRVREETEEVVDEAH